MFSGVKKSLIKLLGGVPIIKEEYTTMRMPSEKALREKFDKELSEQFQAKLAQQEAELLLLKKKLANMQEIEKQNEEFKTIIKQAEEHEIKKEKEEKHKKILLLLSKKKLPKMRLKNENTHPQLEKYPYLAGFQIAELSNGEFEFRPVLTDERKMEKITFKKGCIDFREMFSKTIHIPAQLNNESFESNFDIMNDGDIMLHTNVVMNESTGERMKVVHMDDVERQEYNEKIEQLKKQIQKFQSIAIDSKDREEELQNQLMEQEMKIHSLIGKAVNSKKLAGQALDRQKKIGEQLGNMQLSAQDMILNQQLAEQFSLTLKQQFSDLMDKYSKTLSNDKREIIKKDLIGDIMQINNMINKAGGKGVDVNAIAKAVSDELMGPQDKGGKKK